MLHVSHDGGAMDAAACATAPMREKCDAVVCVVVCRHMYNCECWVCGCNKFFARSGWKHKHLLFGCLYSGNMSSSESSSDSEDDTKLSTIMAMIKKKNKSTKRKRYVFQFCVFSSCDK